MKTAKPNPKTPIVVEATIARSNSRLLSFSPIENAESISATDVEMLLFCDGWGWFGFSITKRLSLSEESFTLKLTFSTYDLLRARATHKDMQEYFSDESNL